MYHQYSSVLRWFDGLAPCTTYRIVHIGPFDKDRDMYLPGLVDKMRTKFPRARSTYWQTFIIEPPYEEEDDSLMQQAKNLLRDLQNSLLYSRDDHCEKPIIFICWGMSGGILLKQMILLLKEYIKKDDDNDWNATSENLYQSIPGVVFFGCAHDEGPGNFDDRVLRSLMFEAGEDWYGDDHVAWEPTIDWFKSTTAEFRNLSLRFPVRTYYELMETPMHRSISSDSGGYIKISEKLCPKEDEVLQASSSRGKTIRMDHDSVYCFTHDGKLFQDLLKDMYWMMHEHEDADWRSNAARVVSVEDNTTRLADMQVREGSPPSGSPGPDSTQTRTRRASDKDHEDHETASRQPVPTKRAMDRQYSPSTLNQPQSEAPDIRGFTIGWICALPFELAAAEAMLDETYPDLPFDLYCTAMYTLGRIGPHKVIIACLPRGRPGLSAASIVATDMRQKFHGIRFGFVVGIGGGVPSSENDIRLGDVVVSLPNDEHGGVVQYDSGKAEDGGKFRRTGHLNNPPTFLLSLLQRVQSNHEQHRRTYPLRIARFAERNMKRYTLPNVEDTLHRVAYPHATQNPNGTLCDPYQIIPRPKRNTQQTSVEIHYGTIASGNKVIKDARYRDKIVGDLGGQILCSEMEAAGLMNDFPCLVVRGISDYCDRYKDDVWQRYAAATAAAYTRELLLLIQPKAVVE